MNSYLWWTGLVFNVVLLIGVIFIFWCVFIWPSIQAISLGNIYIKALGPERKISKIKVYWWAQKTLFLGKDFTALKTNRFVWSDINDWKIYTDEEE